MTSVPDTLAQRRLDGRILAAVLRGTTIAHVASRMGVTQQYVRQVVRKINASKMISMYVDKQWSAQEIATAVGCSHVHVLHVLHKAGVQMRSSNQTKRIKSERTKRQQAALLKTIHPLRRMSREERRHRADEIVRQYLANVPIATIIETFGVTRQRVHQLRKARKISKRDTVTTPSALRIRMDSLRKDIVRAYKAGATTTDIDRTYDVSHGTTARCLRRWKVPLRDWHVDPKRTARWITMYVDKKMSTYEIAAREGYAQSRVYKILAAAGVEIRSLSEAVRRGKKRSKTKKYRAGRWK